MTRSNKTASTAINFDIARSSNRLAKSTFAKPGKNTFEVDHSALDISFASASSGLTTVRPVMTLVMDARTRMVVGCHVGFHAGSS